MVDLKELRAKADTFRKEDDIKNALPLYRELWELDKNEWNGYYLAQCLRKSQYGENNNNYDEAREIQNYVISKYSNFKPINNEVLWLDYSQYVKYIKQEDRHNLLLNAENLLSRVNKNDKYTGSIFNKTILVVVQRLRDSDATLAFNWIKRLDFQTLSNLPFITKDGKYPSEQKTYFILYADLLVRLDKHIEYIDSCLSCLKFEGYKKDRFCKYILENITYPDGNRHEIARMRLGLFIKYFRDEIYNRQKHGFTSIYNSKKIPLVSDLSGFDFCPASYAINETFKVLSDSTWEKDDWEGEKKHLLHRYNEYQKGKDLNLVFNDMETTKAIKEDFGYILKSKLIFNNLDDTHTHYHANTNNSLRGNPNYIFQGEDNKKFTVVEIFTRKSSSNMTTPYSSDLIKMAGYIFELTSLKLDFGFIIYWNSDFEIIDASAKITKRKIRIKNYSIFKIEKTDDNKVKLYRCIEQFNEFRNSKKIIIDGDKISYPNKCLNCSVVSYCNHKTGKFNEIKLPYDEKAITIKSEPNISI